MTNTQDDSPAFWPPAPGLQRHAVDIEFDGMRFEGRLVAPEPELGPRPLVLVIHNYQGLKAFDVHVAEYLARIGYAGLAIDLYGPRVPADQREFPTDPDTIGSFQRRCFEAMVALDHDPASFRALLDAWLTAGRTAPGVDAARSPSALGYCFGGGAVIEAVRGGLDLAAAVSFHGLLQTGEDPNPARFGAIRPPAVPCPSDWNTRTALLIENGAADHLVTPENRDRFVTEMTGAGVDWTFHDHAGAPHGFALPPRLGPPGHLHERADRRSTQALLALLRECYPDIVQRQVGHNAAGTAIPG